MRFLVNDIASVKQAILEYEIWILERPDAEIFAAALMEPGRAGVSAHTGRSPLQGSFPATVNQNQA
jgi:hypothetical protein